MPISRYDREGLHSAGFGAILIAEAMTRVLRAAGVAVLIAATLHATAGICLCHRGPDTPASMPGSHSCCHPADAAGRIAIGGVPTCCHIETAQRDMTPIDVIQLAPPTAVVVAAVADATLGVVATRSLALASAPSPPIRVLRL
jgi:hypothetical protein